MTCIVGYTNGKKVWIGGDSAGAAGLNISIRKDEKVFKNGDFLIGYTSSFRMGQIIRYNFIPPKRKKIDKNNKLDIFKYMCTDFIDELRKTFEQKGFLTKKDNEESGGTFLIGYKGRLFEIESDFQVAENIENYNACGCGKYYALGSLYTSLLNVSESIKPLKINEILKTSLQTAVKFNGGVRPPFIIKSI